MPAVCLSSWCASFTTALPFSSSSPTLSRPTPGRAWSSTSRTYTDPRCAKPTSSRASQSTLAPPSSTRTGCTAVGNSAPIAARCTPSCSRSIRVAAAITAPVLPAEMNASLAPCFWSPIPTATEDRGVIYCYPLLVAVIAAGGTHVMRALQIAAPRARLQRDRGGLVMGAAGALLPLGSPTLGYGHEVRPLSVAELVLQGGQPVPTGVNRAAAGCRVQVGAATRAQPAAVVSTHDPLRQGQQQLLPQRDAEIDRRGVTRQGVGTRVLQCVRILRKQGVDVRHDRDGQGGKTAPAVPGHSGAERGSPIETPFASVLQSACHAHRLDQGDGEPLEQGVTACELAHSVHRATGWLPQVDP